MSSLSSIWCESLHVSPASGMYKLLYLTKFGKFLQGAALSCPVFMASSFPALPPDSPSALVSGSLLTLFSALALFQLPDATISGLSAPSWQHQSLHTRIQINYAPWTRHSYRSGKSPRGVLLSHPFPRVKLQPSLPCPHCSYSGC